MFCSTTAQSVASAVAEPCIQQSAANTSSPIAQPLPHPHLETSTSLSSLQSCAVCKTLTRFKCAECKNVYYCSRGCRKDDYFVHSKNCCRIFKAYNFTPLSRVYRVAVFNVIDFLKGPDQPMDPPSTEAFEDIQHLWRF